MKKEWTIIVLGICIITYLVGMFCIPLMDIDATQYASMSREMLLTGNYLQLYDLGKDYLDKPPMLFWLSSLSLSLFGIHDWAYRLPSILFSFLALYSTYRLTLLFYKKDIALLSVAILASCQAMFLMNHDVRTDTMLMGWVACSIWQLAEWLQFRKWKNALIAAIAIAGGMMTKGPLALMIPAFAFLPHIILRRNWKELLRWEYVVIVLAIAILLIPMSIGLYRQYDLKPGKIILGKTIDSGLYFYYWTQSFGRITGGNTLRENGSIFFLLQNMLWSFLPWVIFLLLGLFTSISSLVQKRFLLNNREEFITVGGFLVTYLALGSSKVQLPHYIFVVLPFAAVITANFLYKLINQPDWQNWRKPLFVLHAIVFALLWIALIFLMIVPFPQIQVLAGILSIFCFLLFLGLLFYKKAGTQTLLAICLFTTIGLNIFLNSFFYPSLLTYQTGNIAAKFIEQARLPKEKVFVYGDVINARNSFYFYGDYFFKKMGDTSNLAPGDYVLTSAKNYPTFLKNNRANIVFTGKGFPVTKLTLKFLNPRTREKELEPFYIVQVN